MALNACELEIDLFCRGMRVPDDVSLAGTRSLSRTRAGLGSGLDVAIPSRSRLKDELWVNVPIVERFARSSPYQLVGGPHVGYAIVDARDTTCYPVRLPAAPAWYSRLTSRDVPMNRIGVLQGTYLAIYVNPVCAFWNANPRLNCKFCTTGHNIGATEASTKAISDVVETCWAAKQESGITFVHLNGGFQGTHGLEFIKPYVKAIKEQVGLLVGVQLAPERDFSKYDELVSLGVDHFSFCIELLDPEWFARVCPGKARVHGQQLYFNAMKYCVNVMPNGAVSGEIIAGLEPIARTLEGIDRITALGAFPTVCIFRPTAGADMEDWPSPPYEEMRKVMEHVYAACRARWMPIGVAPNIEVSLVVNPDDAALLAERTAGFYVYEAYRRLSRIAARPIFRRRMRPD
jgi:uncharacterized radical SAM superfamily protein